MATKKILVVEDDDGIREFLEELLKGEGYEVDTASNGLEALGKLDHVRPNLVLVDLMMPVMDGLTFVYELQRRGLFASLAIIALSANPHLRKRLQALGVHHFLTKPFDLTLLSEKIRHLLNG